MDWEHIHEDLLVKASNLVTTATAEIDEAREHGEFIYPSDFDNRMIKGDIRKLRAATDHFEDVFEKAKKEKLKEVT